MLGKGDMKLPDATGSNTEDVKSFDSVTSKSDQNADATGDANIKQLESSASRNDDAPKQFVSNDGNTVEYVNEKDGLKEAKAVFSSNSQMNAKTKID
jgi:hypothetical protein